jgi:hypothetical protein
MTLELATAFGAATTAYVVVYANRSVLEGLFVAFLLWGAISLLRRKEDEVGDESSPALLQAAAEIPDYKPKRYPLGLGASLVAGGLSGLLGIGGGPIKVPVMYLFMDIPLIVATATSNFMIGVTAAASAFVYFRRGDILSGVAAPLAVGVFVGSLIGAKLSPRIHSKYLIYLLVAIMLYLSGHLAFHLWGELHA